MTSAHTLHRDESFEDSTQHIKAVNRGDLPQEELLKPYGSWRRISVLRITDKNVRVVRVLNALSLLAAFVVNALGSVVSYSDDHLSMQQLSAKYETFLTPADYAFSIWGVIYAFLAAFAVYQLFPSTYQNRAINEGVGWWLIPNGVANCLWIVFWMDQQIAVSMLLMFVLFFTLERIYVGLKTVSLLKEPLIGDDLHRPVTIGEYALTRAGFTMYFAWIVAATLINIFAGTTTSQDDKFLFPAVIGLAVGFTIESVYSIWGREPLVSGVGAWALLAIAIKWNGVKDEISTSAFVLAGLLMLQTVSIFAYNFYYGDRRNGVTLAV